MRLLSNLETASSKLIQIILLLGQPELDRQARLPDELRQLRQRISVRWQLGPLSRKETAAYVAHRLRIAAGAPRDLFSPGALRAIHRRSGGVPRLVNILCDRALLAGFGEGEARVSRQRVLAAAREIPDARSPVMRTVLARWARIAAGVVLFVAAAASGGWWAARSDLELPPLAQIAGALGLAREIPVATVAPNLEAEGVVAGRRTEAPRPEVESVDALLEASTDVEGRNAAPSPDIDPFEPTSEPTSNSSRVPEVLAGAPLAASPLPIEGIDATTGGSEAAEAGVTAKAPDLSASLVQISIDREADAPTGLLGRLVAGRDEDEVLTEAMAGLLGAFGLASDQMAREGASGPRSQLEAYGLTVLSLRSADWVDLRSLNHPALLQLTTEFGEARWVAVLGLDREVAHCIGVTENATIRVPLAALRDAWPGRALVVWRDFEVTPGLLELGESGEAVTWLQTALADLGYYKGDRSGYYDELTRDGVVAFQLVRRLEPDGTVGPRTKMALYDLLERYEVPRLSERPLSARTAMGEVGEPG